MKIRRCDRCEKIMENMNEGYELTVDYLNGFGKVEKESYDICDDCYMKFNEFIRAFKAMESEEQNDEI